jgi:hypothetical protein
VSSTVELILVLVLVLPIVAAVGVGLMFLFKWQRRRLGTDVAEIAVEQGQPFHCQLPSRSGVHRVWLRLELVYEGAALTTAGDASPYPSVELTASSLGQPLISGHFQPQAGPTYRHRSSGVRGQHYRVSYQRPIIDLPPDHGPAQVSGRVHFQNPSLVRGVWIIVTHHS